MRRFDRSCRAVAAGLELRRFPSVEHSGDVKFGTASFNRVDHFHFDMWPVDEAMGDHVFESVRLRKKREHLAMTPIDHRSESIEAFNEIRAAFDNPLLVKRDVVGGVFVAHPAQALFEVFEVAPGIAVVRTESGQVDVREKEDIAFDSEATMAAGMTGEMDGFDREPAEVETVTV